MPVAVIAVSMLVMLVLMAPSEASESCMSKTEARQHFGSVHIYRHGLDHCWDAMPARGHRQIPKVQQAIDHTRRDDSISEMLSGDGPVLTPWVEGWANIEPSQYPNIARWIDIVQVAPPSIIERKPEPTVPPRGVVLAAIAIVLILGTIEVLFRCTIS
jgi:hypothetical protein